MSTQEIHQLRAESMTWRDYGTVDVCDAALGDEHAADALGITFDEAREQCRKLCEAQADV